MKNILCTTVLVETSPQALPLGAACITSAVNSHPATKNDFHASLSDFSLEDDGNAETIAKKILTGENLFAVCFSVYVWNRKILEETAAIIHEKNPEIFLIAGGPEVTANPVSFENFDFTVSGEGEDSVPKLISILADDGDSDSIQGVYKISEKGKYAFPYARSIPLDPEKLSSPYLDGAINLKKYGGALWELARGCPFKCSYCYESRGEKKIKYLSLERLSAELDLFAKNRIPQVFVLDPTYNASKKRALDMLKLIAKKTPDTFYYFEARAEFIDRELAQAFASIPCSLQFGLQSSNEEVLKKVNRTFNKKTFVKNIGFLNQTGAVFGFDLIYGLPGDNLSGFKASIDFALSLYPNNLELFCLSVLPGTALADDAAGFSLEWQKDPPYRVIQSPLFSRKDMAEAERLAEATNLFYTRGRAVPWFNAVLHPLKARPSTFLREFADFLENEKKHFSKEMNSDIITELQCSFVARKYREKKLQKESDTAQDLIRLNGALGKFTGEGEESTVSLHYHPDDLMSEYAADIVFFARNCRPYRNRTKVFGNNGSADWRVLK